MMSDYMFYFAVENGGACPGYNTEKLYLALMRGSIPVYFGAEGWDDMAPSSDAVLDMRRFSSAAELAKEMHAIATDDATYWRYHAWRYQHPGTWNEGFRRLLSHMSKDIRAR